MSKNELRQVPLVPEGTRLRQGATYLDLAEDRAAEFTATGDMAAESGQLLVAKQAVAYELWNRLLER